MNPVIKQFLDDGKITQDEYDILFEDKNSWSTTNDKGEQDWSQSYDRQEKFKKTLIDIINLQKDNNRYDLSFIHFPPFRIIDYFSDENIKKHINFYGANFTGGTDFIASKFDGEANFVNTNFIGKTDFYHAKFGNIANFMNAIFYNETIFKRSTFNNEVYFNNSIFKRSISFEEVYFKELFKASDMSFNQINLTGIYFEDPNLLELSGYDNDNKVPLETKHFANKESARLIKAHFEKQNNITEANKYFVIEQDKYIYELRKNNNHDDKRITKLIPLYLNKFVSNFGTDWVRGILFFMMWGIIANSIFTAATSLWKIDTNLIIYFLVLFFIYCLTYINTKASLQFALLIIFSIILNLISVSVNFLDKNTMNEIVKITNPINAFKEDNIFKENEALGAILRVISATIIFKS